MGPSRREVVGFVLLVAGLAILAWALFTNAFAPAYGLDADLERDEPPPDATVYDYANLSEPGRQAVGRAVETGESVTVRGSDSRAPEFAYNDWCGNDYVRYEGEVYHVCAWAQGGFGFVRQLSFVLAVGTGLVLSVAGLLTSRRRWRSLAGRIAPP